MAMCEACKELADKLKDEPPHSGLELRSSRSLSKISMGRASGHVLHYTCKNCNTQISCDGDSKDSAAGWYVVKQG